MTWPSVRLKELTSLITKGTTPTSVGLSFAESGIPFLRVQNLRNGRVDLSIDPQFISQKTNESLRRSVIRPNDVLLSIAGTIGRAAHVPLDSSPMNCNQAVAIVRPSPALYSPYLVHWLGSESASKQTDASQVTATISNLSLGQLAQLRIPLPHLAEQQRIAAILDQAEALQTKRRQALAKLDTLTQSLFLEMFGDPQANPKQWKIQPFARCVRNEDAARRPVKASDRSQKQGEYDYYGASGVIDKVDSYIFEGERLLIAEDGANLLARSTPIAFRAHGRYWVNNHAHVVAYNGVTSLTYLEVFFSLVDVSGFITGSAQPKLNQDQLNRIVVPIPPLPEQKRFDETVARWNGLRKIVSLNQLKLSELFKTLQYRAFRGEL